MERRKLYIADIPPVTVQIPMPQGAAIPSVVATNQPKTKTTRRQRREEKSDSNDPPMPEQQVWRGFFSSGSTLLDLALGGGVARGRLLNIVGDRSSGKTLLAEECAAGFKRTCLTGHIDYIEAESAFMVDYAAKIGLPEGSYKLIQNIDTIEGVHDRILWTLGECAEKRNKDGEITRQSKPVCGIVDSLDALSSDDELERDIHDSGAPGAKARATTATFRRLIRRTASEDFTWIVISQVRANIGAASMYAPKKVKTGGEALNFYISQEIWLRELEKIKKTVRGQERVIGLRIEAQNRKNKVGPPHRNVKLDLLFNYGIDDEMSCLSWLKEVKVDNVGGDKLSDMQEAVIRYRQAHDIEALKELGKIIRDATIEIWQEIEAELTPPIAKSELFT